jgi:hypothetical protein
VDVIALFAVELERLLSIVAPHLSPRSRAAAVEKQDADAATSAATRKSIFLVKVYIPVFFSKCDTLHAAYVTNYELDRRPAVRIWKIIDRIGLTVGLRENCPV